MITHLIMWRYSQVAEVVRAKRVTTSVCMERKRVAGKESDS